MSELYLIAHKVRGERAFDIATQMDCPECLGKDHNTLEGLTECVECDSLGYWWIIPTSGHRAFPYWVYELGDLFAYKNVGDPPTNLLDHYPERTTPSTPKLNLTALIPKSAPIRRRV